MVLSRTFDDADDSLGSLHTSKVLAATARVITAIFVMVFIL